MADDLAARLRAASDFLEAREADAAPDGPELAALDRDVRRHRSVRRLRSAGVAAAVVVAVMTVGWYGLPGAPDVVPAQPPVPSATAPLEPTPSTAPSTPAALSRAPAVPGLPPAYVMPSGTLEAATPGWVLVTERPVPGPGAEAPEATAHVLDLLSPAGERYRVLDLAPGADVSLARWVAGSDEALVTTDGSTPARLDLGTGQIVPIEGLSSGSYVGRSADGMDLWLEFRGRIVAHDGRAVLRELPDLRGMFRDEALLDATGARMAGRSPDDDGPGLAVVDTRTGVETPMPGQDDAFCSAIAWHGADLVVSCGDGSGGWELRRWPGARADAAPVALAVSGAQGTHPQPGVALPDGRHAVLRSSDGEFADGWGVLDVDAGTFTPVEVSDGTGLVRLRTEGDSVYVLRTGPVDQPSLAHLSRYDLRTASSVELVGVPEGTDLSPGAAAAAGLRSWVVGTRP